jgi:agmatine deiminase
MIPDWQTDCVYFSDLLPVRFWEQLRGLLNGARMEARLVQGTRDIWARDFMPVQVGPNDFVRFRYEPDYLRGEDDWITPDAARTLPPALSGFNLRDSGINLDGGNVVASEKRVILTDKVYRQNEAYTQAAQATLQGQLADALRNDCIFIPQEPKDVIGHADGVLRFVEEDIVVINDYRELGKNEPSIARYREQLEALLKQHALAVERVPYTPTEEQHDGIPSAVGNYVNFLRVGGLVIMPAYGKPQDDQACRKMERLLPGSKVVPLRCEELARDGGVLNCVAWTTRTSRLRDQPKSCN